MEEQTGVPAREVAALEEGLAFAIREGFRKILVSGADAPAWLNDLVTAGVEDLAEGRAVRSLLLSPTGHVRADFRVARTGEGFLLLQDPVQADSIADLLARYVLSADVTLTDRSDTLVFVSIVDPGANRVGWPGFRPSVLGPGMDLAVPVRSADRLEQMLLKKGLTVVGDAALELFRIARGDPRFSMDLGTDSLPAEAGLESAVDFTKGCFLGQESAAKVRNLGHPPRVLRKGGVEGAIARGDPVLADEARVGEVTSVARAGSRSRLICRVTWSAREAALALADGRRLVLDRGDADGGSRNGDGTSPGENGP
jgi:folate-binding protein YgfZ